MAAKVAQRGGEKERVPHPEPTTRQDLGEPDFRRGSPRSACFRGGPSCSHMTLALVSLTLVDAPEGFDRFVDVSRWRDSAILTGPGLSGFDWMY